MKAVFDWLECDVNNRRIKNNHQLPNTKQRKSEPITRIVFHRDKANKKASGSVIKAGEGVCVKELRLIAIIV